MGERFLACLRWSARALVMMSERVGDSLSGRLFLFQEVKERRSERRAKACLCYPERRSFSSEAQRATFLFLCKGTTIILHHQISPLTACKFLLRTWRIVVNCCKASIRPHTQADEVRTISVGSQRS